MSKFEEQFADAVRVLLYGDGECADLVEDLAKILAEYDGTRSKGGNRLSEMNEKLTSLLRFKEITEKLPPLTKLGKAELKYLQDSGWLMYCGTSEMWGDPLAPHMRYTWGGALRIQKERDGYQY